MSTICAISTAKGGAIGIVRVSGPQSINIVDRIFKGHTSLISSKPGRVHFGHIMKEDQILDEVLVTTFKAPHSYTGEDSVEISCHGSSYILQSLLELLLQEGCEMAKPGEYTQRAFLNGKMDLSQAEAVADLIASQNKANHRIAMNQMRGGFSRKLDQLRSQLLEMTSLLELELDFSEEDVEFADRQKLMILAEEIEQEILRLSRSFSAGNAIKNGIPVAIIGAPNVGKSTLLNQLLHDEKAIVSDIQGTTRDLIEDTMTLSGISFRFIDTAGIRSTEDTIEKMGIERSLQASQKAQIIILMTEPGIDFPTLDIREDQFVIRVQNKVDKYGLSPISTRDFPASNISLSAKNGDGIEALEHSLIDHAHIICGNINEDTVLVSNLRHKQALELSLLDIERSLSSLRQNLSGDLVAEDLRQCLSHLSEILGEISTDEVLGNIFKNFCIGK